LSQETNDGFGAAKRQTLPPQLAYGVVAAGNRMDRSERCTHQKRSISVLSCDVADADARAQSGNDGTIGVKSGKVRAREGMNHVST